jgi:DHA1 family multidrug resistance protein-like MFS transporter
MSIKEILRDAPAGQLARAYLGWEISPYEDEQETYQLPQPEKQEPVPQAEAQRDLDNDDGSDEGSSDDKDKDKDIESNAPGTEPRGSQSHVDQSGDRDIERITTEKDHSGEQPNFQEVGFSPMDRDNPQNWPAGKKAFVFFQICLLTFSSQ